MNVEIPSDLVSFVQEMISCGDYRSEAEIFIEGLRLLKSRDELRKDVDAGIKQLEAGQGLDGEAVFARLEERVRCLSKLREMVAVAEEDAATGRLGTFDRDDVKRDIRNRLADRGYRD
jgi:antitoxin ParD1/3/4